MTPIRLLLGLSLLTVLAVAHSTPRRDLEVEQIEGLDFPYITYSDDGPKFELTPFLLDVFETDGDLPIESVRLVQKMTNQFLITQLNKLLPSAFPLEFVNTTVLAQTRVILEENRRELSRREPMVHELPHASLETKGEAIYLRRSRKVEEKVGSALEVTIDVTFDRSPSPRVQEVNEKVKMVMTDLSILLSSLTSSNDPILADIYLIRRRELPTSLPTTLPSASPSVVAIGGAGTDGNDGTSGATGSRPEPIYRSGRQSDSKIGIIAGSLVATAAIALFAFIFAVRNRRRDDEEDIEQKEMFLQIGSDVESSMESHSSTPRGSVSESIETPSSATGSYGKSAADSIFSGISDGESPRQRSIQSKKSMSSQTTVQASGKGPAITPTSLRSPSSLQMLGSLFAYDEVSYEDEEPSSPDNGSTQRGKPAEPSSETPSQLIVQSTPATDVAIVNGQKQITPVPILLRSKTPETDAAVDMGVIGTAYHDPAIHDLLYEGTEVGGMPEMSVKRNLAESSAYGLPPKSPTSKISQAPPTENRLTLSYFGPDDDINEKLPYDPDPLNSDHNTLVITGGAVLSTSTAAAIATRRKSSSPVASPKTQSSATASPILASPKKNKYTGLAATGKSSRASPGVGDKKSKYKELLANLSPKGWRREGIIPVTESLPGADDEAEYEVEPGGAFPTFQNESPIARHRRHAGYKGKGDGTADYQNGAMHPLDWSNKDESSMEGSSLSSHREAKQARKFFFAKQNTEKQNTEILGNTSPALGPLTPNSNMSTLSGNTNGSDEGVSNVSASQQLIQDLVWLEQKIASGKALSSSGAQSIAPTSPGAIEAMDSLSYVSGDQVISPSSNEGSTREIGSSMMQTIICRDCFAPPGKLQIVIHSTKDGPAVHTVKTGSSLEGHMFPGDLIIAVDNVDTRTFSAEAVMKMMAEKHAYERKITVLHYEDPK